MTPDILRKLARELDAGIATEVQVVYLLAGIRKLIERDGVKERYTDLNFHCDWALHSSMNRATAKTILKKFDDAHVLLQTNIELQELPPDLKTDIDRISTMQSFKTEMYQFLAAYDLPQVTKNDPGAWPRFLHLYTQVIEDIPLTVSSGKRREPKNVSSSENISHVTVSCDLEPKTIKHGRREEVLFRIIWTIYDKNGNSGTIFVFNSFPKQARFIAAGLRSDLNLG
jgi:hypothetical protein